MAVDGREAAQPGQSDGAIEVFDGKLDDVSAVLNFKEGTIYLNSQSGPMKREQFIKEYSPLAEDEPIEPVGIFSDVDCFELKIGSPTIKVLTTEVQKLHKKCWQRLEALRGFLEV